MAKDSKAKSKGKKPKKKQRKKTITLPRLDVSSDHPKLIDVLVRIRPDRASLLGWETVTAESRRPVPDALQLSPEQAADIEGIVVRYHKAKGEAPAVPLGYQLLPSGGFLTDQPFDRNRIRGGAAKPRMDNRLFRVDITDTAYLAIFVREQSCTGEEPRFRLRGFFGIVANAEPLPPPPGGIILPEFLRLLTRETSIEVPPNLYALFPAEGWGDPTGRGCGAIASRVNEVGSGAASDALNILIVGDGFASSEIPKFRDHARWFTRALLRTSPYNEDHFNDRINIHIVSAESKTEGISGCPCDCGPTCSFLGSEGRWKLEGESDSYPGFVGIPDPGWVYSLSQPFGSFAVIDCFLVIVNCRVPGGSAFKSQKISFVTTGDADWIDAASQRWTFEQIALHETAHVIANLHDEYIACDHGPIETPPNVHYSLDPTNVVFGDLPWNVPTEDRRSDGTLLSVHQYDASRPTYDANGDPILYDVYGVPIPPTSPAYREFVERVGLFWGAQYVRGMSDCAMYYDDPAGRNFFRGKYRCLMRALGEEICSVCKEAIRATVP